MANPKVFTPLFKFEITTERDIDETSTHVENEGTPEAKTVTETVKVKRKVTVPFCLKTPSRAERENADIERSVWETHFVTKGILPQALLLKVYANHGGILSDVDALRYKRMQADFLLVEKELRTLQVNTPDNKTAIDNAALRFVTLRDDIMDFQQEQAVFFANTAEAKARTKLIEWLILHLSYYKPLNSAGEPGEWTAFFVGEDTTKKWEVLDGYAETQNELWVKARPMLEFLATAWASAGDSLDKDEVEAFAATLPA